MSSINYIKKLHWQPEHVIRFWDYHSSFPENYFTYQYGQKITQVLRPFLLGKKVLDYGCGVGFLMEHFLKEGIPVAGVDSSLQSLQHVKKRLQANSNFLGAYSFEELLQGNQKFDVITLVELVEHLYDPDLQTIFQKIRNVLNPKGLVIVTTPNKEDLNLNEIYCPCCNHIFHRWQHVRSFNSHTLSESLKQCGLKVKTVSETNFVFYKGVWYKTLLKKIISCLKPKQRPHLLAIASFD